MNRLVQELKEAIAKFEANEITAKELAIEVEAIGEEMQMASDN